MPTTFSFNIFSQKIKVSLGSFLSPNKKKATTKFYMKYVSSWSQFAYTTFRFPELCHPYLHHSTNTNTTPHATNPDQKQTGILSAFLPQSPSSTHLYLHFAWKQGHVCFGTFFTLGLRVCVCMCVFSVSSQSVVGDVTSQKPESKHHHYKNENHFKRFR